MTFFVVVALLYVNNNDTHVPRGQPCNDPLFKICSILDSLTSRSMHIWRWTHRQGNLCISRAHSSIMCTWRWHHISMESRFSTCVRQKAAVHTTLRYMLGYTTNT